MKPILFDKTATSFLTNGIGRLDAISCRVTEERNGMYVLELQIAETANHAGEIEMSSIIVAKPSQGATNQPFRVYKITKPINGIFTVLAEHISYQLSYIPVMPFSITASASAANQTLQALKTNAAESCPFNFSTDVTTVASYKQTAPASLRSRLGGVEGSVLDQFGGEYEWDNYDVKLWRNRGVTTPTVSLRYGKNITDLNQEENIENTITGIVPYWQDSEGEQTVTLPEKVVDSPAASSYPFKRTVPYDFSQSFDEDTIPTEAQLRAKAQAYVAQAGIGVPEVSIKLSFINLSDTEEYKDIAALQSVKLCDIVGVYFEKLNISTTAKVVKTIYDVLAEKYESIEIGSLRGTLSSTIQGQQDAVNTLANNTKRMFGQFTNEVGQIVDEATTWLTSGDGFVVAKKNAAGEWKELLFMDHASEEDAVNVLRINENGIGFSSSGVAGPYTQAWTLDGKLVIGGTNVPSLTVYDNATPPNIIFQTSRSGTIWNSTNSSMTAAGILSAVGAILTNATITSTKQNGSALNLSDSELLFKYNNTTVASIITDRSSWGGRTHTYLNINSDEDINLVSDNASWSGDIYDSHVYIGEHQMTLYTGDSGAIADFQINFDTAVLGDQYENLGVYFDGYDAWLTYDTVWFEAGTSVLSGVDSTNISRFNAWGYR